MTQDWLWVSLLAIVGGVAGVGLMRYLLGLRLHRTAFEIKAYWPQVGEFLFSALIVFGVTLLLGETGLLAKFFQKQAGGTYVEKMCDAKYLKETYTPAILTRLRDAAAKSVFQNEMYNGPGSFMKMLGDYIYPMMTVPLRSDFKITYYQDIDTVLGKEVLLVTQTSEWTYENPTPESIYFYQPITNKMEPVKGIKPKDLLRVVKVKIGGKEIKLEPTMDTLADGRYEFSTGIYITIKNKLPIQIVQEKVLPYDDQFTLWMNMPTKDLEFTYKHPRNLIPRFYVFGLGDEEPTLTQDKPDLHVWTYKGWLLKKHGMILYWVRK